MNELMVNAVCYRERNTGKTYLAYISYYPINDVIESVDVINKTKPERLFNGMPALCDEREYFVKVQPDFY